MLVGVATQDTGEIATGLDSAQAFADAVVGWQRIHGRNDLPWQQPASPYRVWVSEIMLQQTQVSRVREYFARFLARFPDVTSLAAASQDQVLELWSGLGYYSRARNLHRAAQVIAAAHAGTFPDRFDQVIELPGIGRSTAGAILSLGCDQAHPILDANVRRVLARCFAVPGWHGERATAGRLWQLAAGLVPDHSARRYNQGMMDLGAMLCLPRKPRCGDCPVSGHCTAVRNDSVERYPGKRTAPTRPERQRRMLIIRNRLGATLLCRRPEQGIWAGLWSLPELEMESNPLEWCRARFGREPGGWRELPPREHGFSHYRLRMHPFEILLETDGCRLLDGDRELWYNPEQPQAIGIPAPISRLIRALSTPEENT